MWAILGNMWTVFTIIESSIRDFLFPKNLTSSVRLVSADGNIGSGKSTLLEGLKQRVKDREEFMIVPEPVEEWEGLKNTNGETILEAFYKDQEKVAFTFQIFALYTRFESLLRTFEEARERSKRIGKTVVVIIERTVLTDYHIFAKMLRKDEKITDLELQVYERWFGRFSKEFSPDRCIYIKTDPELCFERVKLRNRNGESSIPLSYLQACHKQHEEFYTEVLSRRNCIVIDNRIDKHTTEYSDNISLAIDHFLKDPLPTNRLSATTPFGFIHMATLVAVSILMVCVPIIISSL